MIKNRFLPLLLCAFFLLSVSFTKNNTKKLLKDKFIVVLDAGHGGHDPGNLGNGYLEKNIALAIVLKVGELLNNKEDIEVIYTRKDDTFVDLFERGEIANKANANLFVSVHCDSHTSDAHGAGTFVLGLHANKQNFEVAKKENSVIYLEDNYEQKYAKYDINSPESVIGLTIMQEEFLEQSIQLAKLMQDNFTEKLERKDRKVKQAGFIVLHQTFMPSVLVETGFLTNKNEGSYLNSLSGQNQMATAIANAILSYKDGVDANLIDPSKLPSSPNTPEKKEETKEEIVIISPKEEPTVVTKIEKSPKEIIEKTVADAKPENPQTVVDTPTASTTVPSTPPSSTTIPSTVPSTTNPSTVSSTTTTIPSTTNPIPTPTIIFKVQLMASSKIIPLNKDNFRGLDTLSKEPVKNLYRYLYGNTGLYAKAKLLKSNADSKGFTSSYIVAYKDGIRISIKEALKSVSTQ